MKKQEILIIDDDPDYCSLVSELLSAEFECTTAGTGQQGIDSFLGGSQPVIVLVDLGLPDISGFEVCEKLNETDVDHEFAMFVVSGDDNINTKIRAFEAGAADFIAKPFELKELYTRIKRSIQFVEDQTALIEDGDTTKQMANIAMAQASQYSFVMSFFKSLNHCSDHKQVVKLFFDAMSFFNLSASIMINSQVKEYFNAGMSDISPIEKNIYELLSDRGRLYEFGQRLIVNGKNVSFLVKKMPEDEHEAGQVRDFLAALIEGIEAKLKDLELQSGFLYAIAELSDTISGIKSGMLEHNTIMSTVMSDMLTQISASYHSLDLTEEQEQFFTALVESGANKMKGAEALLEKVQLDLQALKSKMELIEMKPDVQAEAVDVSNDDVELF